MGAHVVTQSALPRTALVTSDRACVVEIAEQLDYGCNFDVVLVVSDRQDAASKAQSYAFPSERVEIDDACRPIGECALLALLDRVGAEHVIVKRFDPGLSTTFRHLVTARSEDRATKLVSE
jgi:formyltetrahydrofolate hydrolase